MGKKNNNKKTKAKTSSTVNSNNNTIPIDSNNSPINNTNSYSHLPFVSVCTPTFNRRPFIPIMLHCFNNQTYPKERIEWIIVDDGTDKVEDLLKDIPQIKYLKYTEKLTLGRKRNILNDNAKGDIIIYMDDDDYYPPERISHAVEMLQQNPKALCAGSSAMFIYFKHIRKMYQFGPYTPTHATAATFAFRKELLRITRFSEKSCVAEEKQFLKDYTIPFVQLDSKKSILVFSHIHNSFDKKELLKQIPNPTIHETTVVPSDIVKEADVLKFFMTDIDEILNNYEPGKIENKPDVQKQIAEIKITRDKMMIEYQQQQQQQQQQQPQQLSIQDIQNIINNQNNAIQQLMNENRLLKEKIELLENKKQKYYDIIPPTPQTTSFVQVPNKPQNVEPNKLIIKYT